MINSRHFKITNDELESEKKFKEFDKHSVEIAKIPAETITEDIRRDKRKNSKGGSIKKLKFGMKM